MGIFSFSKKRETSTKVSINAPTMEPVSEVKNDKNRNVFRQSEHLTITTRRRVITKGIPSDYFFGGNDKIECKTLDILTPLPINVYEAYLNGVPGRNEWEGSKCFAIAETEDYIFYNYGCYPDGSGGCNLRQSKANPQKVVFFGAARVMSCVFHSHLVQVSSSARGSGFYLWTKDVHTGSERIYPWFGKFTVPVGRSDRYDQDNVLSMTVDNEQDAIIINVQRTFSDLADTSDAEYICNADTTYTLKIKYSNGDFYATAHFPELNISQIFENINPYTELYFLPYTGESESPPAGLFFSDDGIDWDFEREALEKGLTVEQVLALHKPEKENNETRLKEQDGERSGSESETGEVCRTPSFCRNCGAKLPSDSIFCYICGIKVITP